MSPLFRRPHPSINLWYLPLCLLPCFWLLPSLPIFGQYADTWALFNRLPTAKIFSIIFNIEENIWVQSVSIAFHSRATQWISCLIPRPPRRQPIPSLLVDRLLSIRLKIKNLTKLIISFICKFNVTGLSPIEDGADAVLISSFCPGWPCQ